MRQIRSLLAVVASIAVAGAWSGCQPSGPGAPLRSGSTQATPMDAPRPSHAHTNRLAREKSPYLLQHQHNPVDWHPWGEEAFALARAGNKPIFLSIGYSTCHWCHVMERESFEDEAVAAVLNARFISIKVDREERPDVDKIYMTAVQAMGQGGGWPLNVFLTPDLKPFYGGTYFPPTSRHGRPGFTQLLERIHELWTTRADEILSSARSLHEQLASLVVHEPVAGLHLGRPVVRNAAARLREEYDPAHGGFGKAPKFPRPTQPALVLRQAVRDQDQAAIQMILHTCDRMAAGGINDQLGGGFARYSVDARWLVPHFEKMLYDNAQLANLYLDAHRVSGQARFADVVRDILRYILRDMTHRDGGFYSAEDADSEGHEGKFYCWTLAELKGLLTPAEFAIVERRFGITEAGNFVDHSHPQPLQGQNVLSIVDPALGAGEAPLLASATRKMEETRNRRIRPHLDDKILASWNGMMLGAMARANAVLGDEKIRAAAEKNATFLRSRLWDGAAGRLHSRWRDGERDQVQILDAYANLLGGLLDLYEATLEPIHLEWAVELADAMVTRFHDPEHGGFWQSEPGAKDLILRVKEDYDGAEPSGNSVATMALLRLAAVTGRADLREKAERALRLFGERMQQLPQAVPQLLVALDFSLEEPRRVVITGDPSSPGARALLRAAHAIYQPNKVVLGTQGPVEPFAKTLRPVDNQPTAYVCTGTECLPPTHDPEKLKALLR